MTKTNENLINTSEPQENILPRNNFAFEPPPQTNLAVENILKPDLTVFCFISNEKFTIKYNLPLKKYSQKNNWNY